MCNLLCDNIQSIISIQLLLFYFERRIYGFIRKHHNLDYYDMCRNWCNRSHKR